MIKWLLPLLLISAPTNIIWQWVDQSGVIHFTDSVDQVPEPYYSIYQKRIEELKAKGQIQVNDKGEAVSMNSTEQPQGYYYTAPSRVPPWIPSNSFYGKMERDKAVWQSRVQSNRSHLVALTTRYSELEKQNSGIKNNPYLAALPQNKKQLQSVEQEKAALLQEIQVVKKRLEVDIPEAARKAGIPPGWVR